MLDEMKVTYLTDCTKESNTAKRLISFAETIRKIGSVILILVFVLGLIVSIINGRAVVSLSGKTEFKFSLFFIQFIPYLLSCPFIWLAYTGAALLFEGKAQIIQNLYVSARTAVFEASLNVEAADDDPGKTSSQIRSVTSRQPDKNEWKCSACGRINMNYVTTCPCGKSRYSSN